MSYYVRQSSDHLVAAAAPCKREQLLGLESRQVERPAVDALHEVALLDGAAGGDALAREEASQRSDRQVCAAARLAVARAELEEAVGADTPPRAATARAHAVKYSCRSERQSWQKTLWQCSHSTRQREKREKGAPQSTQARRTSGSPSDGTWWCSRPRQAAKA
eukprot:CAMPEP_0185297462 /NCGR_PEP_ID=MMETSP1363-20130426/9866_1 /TAXON_ID=38817 /ORGANISM="Gephyrocapsa oceanica, Strain RCC1303" /LENGTH=162 /DNA_ID=CAMNT_0027894213 /DNA_START=36 /DNA_END=525 /DNA_ORIENTATION=+